MDNGRPPRTRILICNINPADDGFFVPLIYANLRSYCEQSEEIRTNFDWVDPPMIPESLDLLDQRIDFSTMGIVGISCYQWNYAYQYDLAKRVKEKNPASIIVAGGPHVDYKCETFFVDHPYIDFVISAEGEIPFKGILESHLAGHEDLKSLTGVHINPRRGQFPFRPSASLDMSTRPSPWLSLKDFWKDYFERHRKYRLATSFESARGCPYFCTFCDWGSATNSKMRLVDTDVVRQEMDFVLKELKPSFVFWTDSNLGMAARDIDLVRHFVECKKESGFPKWLYYSNNKNNYERNLEIAVLFRSANLLTKYTLSLQHMDKEILSNLKRKNLPDDQVGSLIKKLREIDYPIFVQFIIGCPGDTFEKWATAFSTLMEMGVHSEYRVYPFNLLPNAPAAEPEYREKWRLDVIERPDFVTYYYLKNRNLHWSLSKSQYVVGSSTFDREDYKKMFLLTWLIMAFHDHGLTQRIAIALRQTREIGYLEFYLALFDWFFSAPEMNSLSARIASHIDLWLTDAATNLLIFNSQIDGHIEPEEDLLLDIYRNFDFFYLELGQFLKRRFAAPSDLIDYQKSVLFRPDFNPETDRAMSASPRWVKFFDVSAPATGTSVDKDGDELPQSYQVDIGKLRFQTKSWFLVTSPPDRFKAFYSQIVQHNVSGKDRTVFKVIEGLKTQSEKLVAV